MNGEHLQSVTESEKAMLDMIQNKRFLDLERVPLICNDIAQIRGSLETITDKMVTQDQFWPIKTLVYGFVSVALVAVVGALIALVLK